MWDEKCGTIMWDDFGGEPIRDNCESTTTSSDVGQWFTFLILFNNFVPISLYVTLEMVNFIQAAFIDEDLHMYDEGQVSPRKRGRHTRVWWRLWVVWQEERGGSGVPVAGRLGGGGTGYARKLILWEIEGEVP